jgi:hypothetical protein
MLETFVGPRPSTRHHAAHAPDRDKTNNRLENLRWVTPEENEADKKQHGTHRSRAYRHAKPALPAAVVRGLVAFGCSYAVVGKMFGAHRHSVSRVCRGLRGVHLRGVWVAVRPP